MFAPHGFPLWKGYTMTFANAINSNNVEAKVQQALDIINDACRQNPDSPRDAGVKDPAKFIAHPLKLVNVEVDFLCPVTGEPMSQDEIENPLYHPVTGAELKTPEDLEAARQWYRQRTPNTLTVDSAWGRKTVVFNTDDCIQEFVDGELLEALAD